MCAVSPEYIHYALTDLLGDQQRWFPMSTPDGSYGARIPLRAGACPDGFPSPAVFPNVFCLVAQFIFVYFCGNNPKYRFVCAKSKGNVYKSAIESRSVTKIGARVDQFLLDFCAKFGANRISGSKVTGRGLRNRAKTVD